MFQHSQLRGDDGVSNRDLLFLWVSTIFVVFNRSNRYFEQIPVPASRAGPCFAHAWKPLPPRDLPNVGHSYSSSIMRRHCPVPGTCNQLLVRHYVLQGVGGTTKAKQKKTSSIVRATS